MVGLLFAVFAYLGFGLATAALALFIAGPLTAGLGLPVHIDASIFPALSPWLAGALDLGLIALFGLQHSVMARPGFKQWMSATVPAHLQRAVYVVATSVMVALLILLWQPLPAMVWQMQDGFNAMLVWMLYGIGWLLLVAATFMIDHFELFGLAQPFRRWRGLPPPNDEFRTSWLYRYMRHPIYSGWLVIFWATPQMSAGHLLFAIGMSAYILVGILYEERDLIAAFGDRYRDYRRRVPALIPGLKI
ncbi:MAG: NnrU family protein [Ferrovibrio sp.]|uniref:methyltransferase family protein n=1 Tax=Ferrovibrio sp. TaxID=1917215 RepID=UPI00262CEC60|nr:NnrU family protein [Ferrovibrio sp.]MCW0235464.1 NnrU family protein [Ferrovibrio sp.]